MVENFGEPGAYDAVVFLQTIEHVQDPEAVLAHIRRLLAPGGVATSRLRTCSRSLPPASRGRTIPGTSGSTGRRSSGALRVGLRPVELLGLFHARKLRAHALALAARVGRGSPPSGHHQRSTTGSPRPSRPGLCAAARVASTPRSTSWGSVLARSARASMPTVLGGRGIRAAALGLLALIRLRGCGGGAQTSAVKLGVPAAGRYTGKTSQGLPITLIVAPGGRTLTYLGVEAAWRCTNGETARDTVPHSPSGAVPLKNGAFRGSFTSRAPRRGPPTTCWAATPTVRSPGRFGVGDSHVRHRHVLERHASPGPRRPRSRVDRDELQSRDGRRA